MLDQRIECEDVLVHLERTEGATYDFAFLDLPYGTTADPRDRPLPVRVYGELVRVMKPGAAMVFTTAGPFTTRVQYAMMTERERRRFVESAATVRPHRLRWHIVWEKPNATPGGANGNTAPAGLPLNRNGRRRLEPLRCHEDVLVYTPGGGALKYYDPRPLETTGEPYNVRDTWNGRGLGGAYAGRGRRYPHTSRPNGRRDPRSVIRWANDARQGGTKVKNGPPYQKPQSMVCALLEALCPPDGLAFEPCCGAAPMARAARRLGRRSVSVDNYPPYVEAARDALGRVSLPTKATA